MKILEQYDGENHTIYHGDCVDVMRGMAESYVDLTTTSIPFSTLFSYSNSDRDFGNSASHEQFFAQFDFFVRELLRVTKPGSIAAIHCMNLQRRKSVDGDATLYDFRGDVIRAFTKAGWYYASEVTVWKDPVTAAVRTHAHGLLYKTLLKDSCQSRMGLPDYVVAFRKPGERPVPVSHTKDQFSLKQWQEWASPVWMTVDQTNTLQFTTSSDPDDLRHICPLQLDVIERCVEMWSNPGEVVFDPYGGIGSTGYVALEKGRRAVLAELKEAYVKTAVKNLAAAEPNARNKQVSLFDSPQEASNG